MASWRKNLGPEFSVRSQSHQPHSARRCAPGQCGHCRDRPRFRRAHPGAARRRRSQSRRDRARRACLAALAQIAKHYPGRLDVIEGDALETDFAGLIGTYSHARVCANLPYNIATPLLVRWLETEPWPPWFDRLVLMFQREVAERIIAGPLERAAYGRLAVLSNWRCETRILFDIPAAAFTPPPKVRSSLVELVPRPSPLACDRKLLAEVTRAAFGQRRKMLRQSLKSLAGGDAAGLLARADIDPMLRAEDVGIEGFAALARALGSERAGDPGRKPNLR